MLYIVHNIQRKGMVDVINQLCLFEGCDIMPSYNYEGGKRLYCVKHKLKNMIAIDKIICIYENCKKKDVFIIMQTNKKDYIVMNINWKE